MPARRAPLCCLLLALAGPARGDGLPPLQAQLKAAYLYQFATHVDWPPPNDQPMTIAVAGAGVNSFVAVDQWIRFAVSLARAGRHGLKISARLLGVAYKTDGRMP